MATNNSSSNKAAGIINAMAKYLQAENEGFYKTGGVIYCRACETIRYAQGSYMKNGSSLFENPFDWVERNPECSGCKATRFNIIYPLTKINFEEVSAQDLDGGIKNGLKYMRFPTLYNKDLFNTIESWNKLNDEDKLKELKNLESIVSKVGEHKKTIAGLLGQL